jgi:polyhydroxyalkanoate synthesis repressor PhaR
VKAERISGMFFYLRIFIEMLEPAPIRLIKRYPNRRLYDVHASRYVNLGDIRQLVIEGEKIQVLVEKTNEDLTTNVLLQIFLDLELSGRPIFTDQALKNLIVMNNTFSRGMTESYLSNFFGFFKRES